jgi:hypothetical protein
MHPGQIKHLEFIQNVITRMNTNSFQIKGWSIVIVSALMAVYASTQNSYFFLAAPIAHTPLFIQNSKYTNILVKPMIIAKYIFKIVIEKNALQYEYCPPTYKECELWEEKHFLVLSMKMYQGLWLLEIVG